MPEEARMWAKKWDELTCSPSSRRLRSFQAGSTLRKMAGVSDSPYHPMPKPSPFVVSAPSLERRL